MIEVFMYQMEWAIDVCPGDSGEMYGSFHLTIADPVEAMPVILKAVEQKWGKPARVVRFSGPNGSNNFYIEGGSPANA